MEHVMKKTGDGVACHIYMVDLGIPLHTYVPTAEKPFSCNKKKVTQSKSIDGEKIRMHNYVIWAVVLMFAIVQKQSPFL